MCLSYRGCPYPAHKYQGIDPDELTRIETRGSVKSKVSRVLSAVSRRSKKERMPFQPLPTSNLDEGVVGWDGQDDPDMPYNFAQRKKWLIVGLLAAATLVTPFASSILSPGIAALDKDFGNENTTLGAMTVSIFLLGYCVGPLFLAPLSEIYGRKPILGFANMFFCAWQIGCALAPNLESLIVFRFFSGVGGAGCIVSDILPEPHVLTSMLTDLARLSGRELLATFSVRTREVSPWGSTRWAP